MARIRTVKPEFFTDESLAECSPSARLLLIGMLCFADDCGNIEASPMQLKMRIFPADNLNVAPLVEELVEHNIIMRYGGKYLHIKGFLKHQKIERPSPPRFPLPDNSPNTPRQLTEHSVTDKEGKGIGLGREVEVEVEGIRSRTKKHKATGKIQPAPLVIPTWIPLEAWGRYIEMRKTIRKPATKRALELAIEKLDKLRAKGDSPQAVLEQSIFNSWQGLFPLRKDGAGRTTATAGNRGVVEHFERLAAEGRKENEH